jgi:phosphoglucosamine mutase
MMVDANGNLLDGDQLLYIIATGLHAKGELTGGIAGTLMTNLAMEHALQKHKIPFARSKVGDRYVLELLNEKNWKLGGENSGHILTLDKHTSGDAIIAALQVLHAVKQSGKTLTQLNAELVLYPQVLINVTTKTKLNLEIPQIQNAVKNAETELNGTGRVLLRASGTEPKIRVMVEGQDGVLVQKLAEEIAEVVRTSAS